jgi:hypothetical protein
MRQGATPAAYQTQHPHTRLYSVKHLCYRKIWYPRKAGLTLHFWPTMLCQLDIRDEEFIERGGRLRCSWMDETVSLEA